MAQENLVVTKHRITQRGFEASARAAIKQAFKKKGYPPNEIWVLPGTTEMTQVVVKLGSSKSQKTVTVPVSVRDYLTYGFGITAEQFVMDTHDPTDPRE